MRLLKASPWMQMAVFALLCLIWGYNWVVMKWGLASVDAHTFNAWRMVIGMVAAVALTLAQKVSLAPPRPFWPIAAIGWLQTTLYLGFLMVALAVGGAGKTSLLVFSFPFWVALLAPMMGVREPWRAQRVIALLLAALGLLLLLEPWQGKGGSALAQLLGLASGLVWAIATLLNRRFDLSPSELNQAVLWQALVGGIPLVLWGWWLGLAPMNWQAWVAVTYAGVLSFAVGWWLWVGLLQTISVNLLSLNTLSVPVIALLAGWWQLGERPQPIEGGGMVLVLLALGLLRRR